MDRPWGRWVRMFKDDQCELRRLEVLKHGFCTLHYHRETANVFVVIRGVLRVCEYKEDGDGWLVEENNVKLAPVCSPRLVGPMVPHRFWAETEVVAYELNIATGPGPYNEHDSVQLNKAGVGDLRERYVSMEGRNAKG